MPVTQAVKPSTTPVSTDATVHSIGIAGLQVVTAPEMIRTVLGSCIGIAIFDRVLKVGGMAHIILPSSQEGSGDPCKFADTAVDLLLERVVTAGAERKRLVAKIAGGASMFGKQAASGLGERNAEAVKARLTSHAIRLAGSAVGGTKGRKMLLNPANGEVQVEVIGEAPQTL